MNETLHHWNCLAYEEAVREIMSCCGSKNWAESLVSQRPLRDEPSVLAAADVTWQSLNAEDWLEAFRCHPRIGESRSEQNDSARSAAWSAQEQEKAASANGDVKLALARGNQDYEKKFGHIFIVCATGKPASEILGILRRRMQNDAATELRQAAEEQRQIMHIRLKKWLKE